MIKHITIFLVFVLLLGAFTFPLATHFNTHITGFFSTDEPYGALWDFWRVKQAYTQKTSLRTTSMIAYPYGMDLLPGGLVMYIGPALNYMLGIVMSPAAAWNIQVVLNLCLSALIMYMLVVYATESRIAGIFSGIAFGFCPYQFARAWQHLGLTYNEWIPLVIFMAILAYESFSKENIGWLLMSIVLLFSFDYSVAYMGAIALLSFYIFVFFYNWRFKIFRGQKLFQQDMAYLKKSFGVMLLAGIVLSPQIITLVRNITTNTQTAPSAYNPFHKPFEDLFAQSARPLSYLLPASSHPVFGEFTSQMVGSSLYGSSFTEHTLYLGWIVMVLALSVALRWFFRKSSFTNPSDKMNIGFFIFLAAVAWLFSQPPWWTIGKHTIHMPSYFMYKVFPMYRAYARFGIVLMCAVSVLAGFGLKFILDRFKNLFLRWCVGLLFCAVVMFEFWNWPPYKIIDVSTAPDAYVWLKDQPGDFGVAVYPLDAGSPNEMYKFYQITHGKKIINGTKPGSYAHEVAQELIKLSDPHTAGILQWMKVKYVFVHRDKYESTGRTEDKEELKIIPGNTGLSLVKSFPEQSCPQENSLCAQSSGPIDVYSVTAAPVEPAAKEKVKPIVKIAFP